MESLGAQRKGEVSNWTGLGSLTLFLLLLPVVVKDVYLIHLVNLFGIYSLLTTGLNVVLGVCGQISVGHAAFWAVGAYTSSLLTVKVGLNFWLGFLASGIAGSLAAFALGPVLRLRGNVLAVATIAFGEVVRVVLMNWTSLTNGPSGIAYMPPPRIGFIQLNTEHSFYYLILVCSLSNILVLNRLIESRVGKIWKAIRDDEEGAESLGVNATKLKIYVFAVAGFGAGLAGSLYAHLTSYISPHIFSLSESVKMLTMIVVGGEGSVGGAIIGTGILIFS
jgi:branched-chain amino acid transport system permease protein